MSIKKFILLLSALIFLLLPLTAQDDVTFEEQTAPENTTAFSNGVDCTKTHWLTGISSIFTPSLVIGAYNRWITKNEWAQVTWDDMTNFDEKGLVWDNDWYWTNFILHPYQGGLYYMGARNANFGSYGSLAIAFLGSTVWEYFCEANSPSRNDMIFTTFGGMAVGEMLFRLSLNGTETWRPLGYILNPMRLYTDFTTKHKPGGELEKIYELSLRPTFTASFGYTKFEKEDRINELYPALLSIECNVVYNDPYGHDSNDPYSQFELAIGGGLGVSSGIGFRSMEEKLGYDIHVLSHGMILSRNPNKTDETKDTTFGLGMDFDFVWRSFFNIASIAPGLALKQRIYLPNSKLEWQLHLDAILCGATEQTHIRRHIIEINGNKRAYTFTTGAELVTKLKWTLAHGDILDFNLHAYAMYDYPDSDKKWSAEGWEFPCYATLTYEMPVSKRVSFGVENDLYWKHSFYKNYSDATAVCYSAGIFARINF